MKSKIFLRNGYLLEHDVVGACVMSICSAGSALEGTGGLLCTGVFQFGGFGTWFPIVGGTDVKKKRGRREERREDKGKKGRVWKHVYSQFPCWWLHSVTMAFSQRTLVGYSRSVWLQTIGVRTRHESCIWVQSLLSIHTSCRPTWTMQTRKCATVPQTRCKPAGWGQELL